MNATIWKFPLKVTDQQTINFPSGAKILTVQMQDDVLCIWAIVPPDHNYRYDSKVIYVVGTGNPMPSPSAPHLALAYIGTVQQRMFVWHVFEEK